MGERASGEVSAGSGERLLTHREARPAPVARWSPGGLMGTWGATPALGYVAALLGVLLVTWLIVLVDPQRNIGNVTALYLVVVLAVASTWGSGPAVLASALAFLAFNYFFLEPIHNFYVNDPSGWVALLLFLLTAIVTGQLAAGQRARAREAEQREREARSLARIGRLLVSEAPERRFVAVAEHLRAELHLEGCAILLADSRGSLHVLAADGPTQPGVTADWKLASPDGTELAPGRWVRLRAAGRGAAAEQRFDVPLRVGEKVVGALRLVRGADEAPPDRQAVRLAAAAADQLAAAAERNRLAEEATQTELLRRSDELKSVLLSSVSHDLRTPLASITTSVDSLLQPDIRWKDEQRRAYLSAIRREADRLNRLVGNLLDLSRIEGGALQPNLDWYPLAPLVDEILARLRPLTREHRVLVDIPDELPPARFDYVQVGQVLSNLVENGAKYTPAGTELRLSARRIDGMVRVDVADHAPGLADADLERVFDKFFRVGDDAGPRPGTGLGLAIARGLVLAQGGRLWAQPTPGGGVTFSFTLPLDEQP